MIRRCGATLAAAVLVFVAPPASGQSSGLSGYVQVVPVLSSADTLPKDNVAFFNRLRVTTKPGLGPFSFDVAYELAAVISRFEGSPFADFDGFGGGTENSDWLQLQWTVSDGKRVYTQHRFDRLRISWRPIDDVEVSVGRQAVSWGTTLFLTPADPFLPYRPTDALREFRSGIDAVRFRFYPDPLSELDLVIRPSRLRQDKELTALGRALTTWNSWEVSAWAGILYGDASVAAGAAGGVGAWAVRFEAVIREVEDSAVWRGTIGVDRTLELGQRDLSLVLEYQRDGLGTARPSDFERLLVSREFRRGELQVLGRDELALQASYQVHPLWNVSGLALWNLNSGGAVLAPRFSYSLNDEATFAGVVYFELGERIPAEHLPSRSQAPGPTAFLSLTWYF